MVQTLTFKMNNLLRLIEASLGSSDFHSTLMLRKRLSFHTQWMLGYLIILRRLLEITL